MASLHVPRGRLYDSVLETIGGTPLVEVGRLTRRHGCVARVLVKLETFNPLASVKDRAALGMVNAAEEAGKIRANGTLVEATSGNTGIGLAMVAAVKGYHLILTMPENMSEERRKLLRHLGADIILTPAALGMAGAVDKAKEIADTHDNALLLSQFSNAANPAIHAQTTAEEIWQDTQGRVDAFVAGVGTGGTLQGTGQRLKAYNSALRVIAVQPEKSPVLTGGPAAPHGIQGIGANFFPPVLDLSLIDDIMSISDEEAIQTAQEMARCEAMLVGISSGAAMAAALRLAQRPEMTGKTIVTLAPDTGERYLSTDLFSSFSDHME